MKLREKSLIASAAVISFLLVSVGYASAAPPDPTGGLMDDVATDVETWVSTYAVPAMATLLVLGIILAVGIRWARKIGRSV